jgi:fructosamine-3-kinase
MWQEIEQAIARATGARFRIAGHAPVGGGCINRAVRVHDGRRSFFVKLNTPERLAMFTAEAAGLAAIRASATVKAPEPIVCGGNNETSWLVLEYIEFGPGARHSSSLLGEQLARMHRNQAPQFGWECDNTIGSTPQHNAWSSDWTAFLGEHRLGFQLRLAQANGAKGAVMHKGELLLAEIPRFFLGYQPAPSLLHGDLWSGNKATDRNGNPVLFDPALYYGDRETDLAMTGLFGGFDQDFYAAYDATWPLDPGYPVRRQLYNLYHLLNHFNLFGGGYLRQAEGQIDFLLAEL